MLPRHYRICRSLLQYSDVEASILSDCAKPLIISGFKAYQTILVFQYGQVYPLGAYRFIHKDRRQVFVYFHRINPLFYVVKGKHRYRSKNFIYPHELADSLAKRLSKTYIKARKNKPGKIS